MKRLLLLAAAVAFALPASPQHVTAQQQIEIDEWEVPWAQSRPRDPMVGPDGRVWFVGQRSDYVAFLDPATGDFTRFDLEEGAGPHNQVVDPDGTVWYTGNRASHLGRLDPETGDIEKFMMPDERARDPHTLIHDADGNFWFTVQGGNFIGYFDKATRETRLVEAPEVQGGRSPSSRPYGIKVSSENEAWATLFNTNLLARVNKDEMELDLYELPEGARPRRLVIDSHDIVWYVDYARGYLGRLDPETREVREWPNPGGEDSRPYGVAIDEDDRVWFVETGLQPNRFVGFDTETEEFFSVTEVGSGGGSIRHMYFDPETDVVWFGTDANTIGRANLPPKRENVTDRQ
jgi:virginiamycin B lyase